MIKLDSIKANPSNPRIIKDDKFKKLVTSIKDFPKMMALRPMVVDANGMVLGGNMRLKALQELKFKEVPEEWVNKASDLSPEEIKRFIIVDNVGFGDHDWEILANEWDIEELQEWGLDIPDFAMHKEAVEDDYEIPDEIETDIVLGDLFEIGQHRLLCGDSTKAEDVARLMNGEKADMVFTDPPYNMGAGFTGTFAKSMKNTQKRLKKLIDFDPYSITHILHLDCGSYYIFTSKNLIPVYLAIFKGYNFNILFWAKTNPVPHCYKTFLPDIEYLLFFSKGGKMIWNSSLTPTSIYKKYYISEKLEGREHAGDLHPTMKPVKLIADKVKINSNNNGIVLDIFGGAGPSMVASHQLGRRGFLMDNEPKYCWVIVDRMLKLAPAIEIKKNGKPYIHHNITSLISEVTA